MDNYRLFPIILIHLYSAELKTTQDNYPISIYLENIKLTNLNNNDHCWLFTNIEWLHRQKPILNKIYF